MRARKYGAAGPWVALLHGGPGAPGYLAPVARGLADAYRVLEPLQRGSGSQALTVSRHVEDLRELLDSECGADLPHLVGHSWGAMLALAFAAAHPGRVASLALVGCGTFDTVSRAQMLETCEERTGQELRERLARLPVEVPDPDERLRRTAELTLPVYSHELADDRLKLVSCDARAHRESWDDMLRLQDEGVYPQAFAAIEAPVLMLHGSADPHPGRMIRNSLAPFLPRLEYYEWARCGHYPWLEKAVREDFFAALRRWLALSCRS